jgi:signal transduction histidine kinase
MSEPNVSSTGTYHTDPTRPTWQPLQPLRPLLLWRWLKLIQHPYWLVMVALSIAFVAGHAHQPIGYFGHLILAIYVACALQLEHQAKRLNRGEKINPSLFQFSALATGAAQLAVGLVYVVFDQNQALGLTVLTLSALFSLAATLSLNPKPMLWTSIACATAFTCITVIFSGHDTPTQMIAATTLIGLAIQGNQLRDLHLNRVGNAIQQSANAELIEQLETERARADKNRIEAEEASRAKTRFMAAASHDLRQPLTALSLYAASLNQVARGEATKEIAQHIDTSVTHLEKLFNALLDLSKLDAGVVQADSQRFSIQELMPSINKDFRDSARLKGLSFECHGPDLWLETDAILLERILRNLIENAIRYTATGHVHIHWHEIKGQCVIDVTDSGVGIAQEERNKIFDEYYQIEKSGRDRTQGLGVGLAIVRRLADLLRLDLVLESRLGFGSTFRLIGRCAPRVTIEAAEPPVAVHDCAHDLRGLRLLLVDDDIQIRHAAKLLFKLEQVDIQLASNRAQAMEAFPGVGPQLVIADFRLADGESGLDVLNALKQRQPSLHAMIITGDTGPEPLNLVLASGYRIVHKPMSAAQLIAHARALVGDPPGISFAVQDRRATYRL